MIAIGNALGYGNCSRESDIDLVVVTAPRRIWTVRLLVVAFLRLFRQRPGEHTRDAICPSFFLTTEAMNLEPLQIVNRSASAASDEPTERALPVREPASRAVAEKPGSEERVSDFGGGKGPVGKPEGLPTIRDPYLLFWLTQLTVLYDVNDTYAAFWRANEAWVRRWLPDARPRGVHPRIFVGSPPPHVPPPGGSGGKQKISPPPTGRGAPVRLWRERGWVVGDTLERWCRAFQERRFSPGIRALANIDSRVVVTDRILKFHTNDRRAEYRERWVEQLRA